MSLHPNGQRMLDMRVRFNTGETDVLRDIFVEESVWHAAGDNALSGDFHGREQCTNWFVECAALMAGTAHVEMQDVLTDDTYVVFFLHLTGSIADRTLDQLHMNAWRFEHGRAVEGWFLPDDLAQWDAFVGSRPVDDAPVTSWGKPRGLR
jgi:ketosteroid isomerase-like protein